MRWLLALILAFASVGSPAFAGKRIAMTFDDVPRHRGAFMTPEERTQRIIAGLRQAEVRQAAFFLNPGRIDRPDIPGGEARIAAYVAAGHVIANHTQTHKGMALSDADEFLADVDAAEAWLRGRPGLRPWMRFPFLHEGGTDKAKRDAVRAGLKARGLSNGYVTADGSDWFLDNLVIKARAEGKELDMEQLRRLYIRMHLSSAEAQDDLARKAIGRSPVHVMLMHETDIAALFLPDLVSELRRHGWRIVSADEAYRDRLKDVHPDVPNARGDLISAIAAEKGTQWPIWPIWIHPGLAEPIFNERVIKKAASQ